MDFLFMMDSQYKAIIMIKVYQIIIAGFLRILMVIWIGYGLEGLVKWKNGKVISHFTTTDGLPSNRVNAIDEDKDGNLLIGTGDGLSIYNGVEFTNYNFTHGLGNGYITDINVVGNNIWIGCGRRSKTGGPQAIGGGLSIFNGKTFKSFDLSTFQNMERYVSAIRVIKKDEIGNMWIGTEAGLLKYDGSKFHLISNGLPGDRIADILIDDNGLWLCTDGLANMIDDGIKVVIPIGIESLTYEGLQSISRSNDGIYFIGAANGVYLYDPNSSCYYCMRECQCQQLGANYLILHLTRMISGQLN